MDSVENIELSEFGEQSLGDRLRDKDASSMELVSGVKVSLSALLGEAEITVGELFDLRENSIVQLDRDKGANVELVLDGKVIASGELVVVNESFGIKISSIAQQ